MQSAQHFVGTGNQMALAARDVETQSTHIFAQYAGPRLAIHLNSALLCGLKVACPICAKAISWRCAITDEASLSEKEKAMTFLSNPRGFTAPEFADYVARLKWAKGWRPTAFTLHNTALPNLKQWAHFGLGKEQGAQRVCNLNAYYKKLGWHSGPHLFVAPDFIWIACDLEQDGVHASCFNKTSIGVEMVGDYSTEAFDSGDGAKVRDNAVAAIAALCSVLKLDPATLRFHRECKRDHHDCPGARVDKSDFIARVKKALAA